VHAASIRSVLRLTDDAIDITYKKAEALLDAGCVFSEFGTRRRRSYYIQDLVVKTLIQAAQDNPGKGNFAGTSNVTPFITIIPNNFTR
jgi:nicotinate phosphoribosyltransferase